MACNYACSEVKGRHQAGLQPVDLLRLFLDIDAQLVAILLLNLLVAALFGLVHRAVELLKVLKEVTKKTRKRMLIVAFFWVKIVIWLQGSQITIRRKLFNGLGRWLKGNSLN